LEAGSGTGRFTVEFAKRGTEVVALDYSLDSLKINKSRCKCHVVCADLSFLPFKDSVFDKVACIEVFQHVPPRSRIAGLKEIRRVVKEGAEGLITVYNNRLWDKIRNEKEGFHKGLIYYYRFDISELKQMLLLVFSKIVDIRCLILEENRISRPAFSFLYRTGLARSRAYISFLFLIGKTPPFHLLADRTYSIVKVK
jgi:ubiquinone/menaquinone biosynthesis C-methylase UbiE